MQPSLETIESKKNCTFQLSMSIKRVTLEAATLHDERTKSFEKVSKKPVFSMSSISIGATQVSLGNHIYLVSEYREY